MSQAALLMGMIFFVSVSLLFFDFLLEEESQQQQQEEDDQFIEGVARAVLSGSRRRRRSSDGNGLNKRTRIDWDHNRAKLCVQHDYWGPQPHFPDRQFERVFRITRAIADRVLSAVARADTFFTKKPDALGNPGICPKVKLLMGLKCIAYGVSPSVRLPRLLPDGRNDWNGLLEETGKVCFLK